MAVYTDVSDEELEAFIASYAIGALTSFKGIAEGVENSNYLVHTESGRYILTLYEKRVSREDLPYFLALMEHLAARGITCPLPVQRSRGPHAEGARGAAGGAHHLSRRARGCAGPASSIAPASATRLARFHLAGARFPHGRAPTACRLPGWQSAVRRDRQRRRQGHARTERRDRKRACGISKETGRATCRRGHSCRSVPRQCLLSRRQGLGPDRLLFRLQRHARLRHRRLPQCLVLRDRRQLQRHQGAGAARGLREACAP